MTLVTHGLLGPLMLTRGLGVEVGPPSIAGHPAWYLDPRAAFVVSQQAGQMFEVDPRAAFVVWQTFDPREATRIR